MRVRRAYTLVELMIVILIVSILSAISVPLLRGHISAAKWAEGKTMAGTIAVAIRTYIAGTGIIGSWNQVSLNYEKLGFRAGDFNGTYFSKDDFEWTVTYDGSFLDYTIIINRPVGIGSPERITLGSNGNWGE